MSHKTSKNSNKNLPVSTPSKQEVDSDIEESEINEPTAGSSSSSTSITSSITQTQFTPPIIGSSIGMNGLFGNTSIPSTLPQPPKLGSTDAVIFADWKIKFTGYCLMQGLQEVVTSSYSDGLTLAIAMDQSNRPRSLIELLLKALHTKAFGVLLVAVEGVTGPSIFNEIANEQSISPHKFIDRNANYLWDKLCTLYEKKTVHSALHVWKKLLALSYKDGENPQIMRKTFDSLLVQLGQIKDTILPGQLLSEGFKACIWLNALPHTLESTTQTLLTQQSVSFEDIYQTLVRRFESSGSSRHKPTKLGNEVANTAVSERNNNKQKSINDKQKTYYKFKCNHCKMPGHTEDRCYKKHGYSSDRKEKESNDQHSFCFIETTLPPEPDPVVTEVDEVAGVASEDGSIYLSSRDEFILDSGASKHIVFDHSLLINTQEVNPIRLTGILKNSVLINKTGSVRLTDTVCINNVACVSAAGANLICVSKVFDAGFRINWSKEKAEIRKGNQLIITFHRVGGIYIFRRQSKGKKITSLPSMQIIAPKPKSAESINHPPLHRNIPKKNSSVSASTEARTTLTEARSSRSISSEVAHYFVETPFTLLLENLIILIQI
jgi:hypothetical protein